MFNFGSNFSSYPVPLVVWLTVITSLQEITQATEDLQFLKNDSTQEIQSVNTEVETIVSNTSEIHGRKHHHRHKRVVGGERITPGDFPWLVSLYFAGNHPFQVKSGFKHLCGGILIHPQWVLSAAHCFNAIAFNHLNDTNYWTVVAGEYDLRKNESYEQIRAVEKIIRHENSTTGKGSAIPYQANIDIISDDACKAKLSVLPNKGTRLFTFYDAAFCAMGNSTDACNGDSGGPLQCCRNGEWIVVGIVSFGLRCGIFPGGYANVNYFYDWIQDKINNQ
ncbi:hyaluronan-binding protein 2 [Octopus vulgaris]|uniref:Hyaluronan-binding protein 2 n=1 Tax=Octopus vulgaris TaxID=6645 RepID=A0AA36AQM5_OCTVU|nr:hyaluronan-binding protein 2 [Octopus vulgaris]